MLIISKSVLKAALIATVAYGTLGADVYTSVSPAELAKEQESLSKKIVLNYAKKKDISRTLDSIEHKQEMLKHKVNDPEIKNLLSFLNLCLNDIKRLSSKPYNHNNMQRIADLSNSIGEGSRYIAKELR